MLEIGLIFRALMRNKIGALLIALQIALTLAIMVNAIFMIQDRNVQMSRPSGLDESNTFYLTNTVFGENYNLQAALQTDLQKLRNMDGIDNAIQINAVPLSDGGWSMGLAREPGEDKNSVGTAIYMVDEHGIDTLGVKGTLQALNQAPHLLLQVKNLKEKKLNAIISSWQQHLLAQGLENE